MKATSICAAGSALAVLAIATTPAMAACRAIRTGEQLQTIKNHPAGDYCLRNDIDLSSISNFIPIGTESNPFTGSFDGGGFVIRNLKTSRNNLNQVGLFGLVNNGIIHDVTLENAVVVNRKDSTTTGVLVGTAAGTTQISNVKVMSGKLAYVAVGGSAGGLAGYLSADAVIENSSSAANVEAEGNSNAGGLVGMADANAAIRTSYATGSVFCAGSTCNGGGLTGLASGAGLSISKAFATGNVVCSGYCGGLVGDASSGHFLQLYAAGTSLGDPSATVGGLFGRLTNASNDTTLSESFSVAFVGGGASTLGGLIGTINGGPSVTHSYWDKDTSHIATSAAGTGRTSAQLQAALPAGFSADSWAITPTYSYPYLTDGVPNFYPQLATTVSDGLLLTVVPISQLDKSNYRGTTNNIGDRFTYASLAACYTMIARAIGNVIDDARLVDLKIDRYFYTDTTQDARWRGPVQDYASPDTLTPFHGAPLTTTVVPQMKNRKLVILHGSWRYRSPNNTIVQGSHSVLGTSFTTNAEGEVTGVLANDPYTGEQVVIDPVTRKVVTPENFPLRNFVLDAYMPVTIDVIQ